MKRELTFNDLPQVVMQLVDKVTGLTDEITELRTSMQGTSTSAKSDAHRPMTVDEACEYLGMSTSTFYYKVGRGEVPAVKQGKRYYIYKDELDAWLEKGRKNEVPKSFEEENATMLASFRNRANTTKKGDGYGG